MLAFEPENYGMKVAELLSRDRLCELGPGRGNQRQLDRLESLKLTDIAPAVSKPDMAACCISGLWLWHDFLDRSHQLSQEIHHQNGSYWHAIMHRREPDYSNAKYWFRRVGDHGIYPALQACAGRLGEEHQVHGAAADLANAASWDPYAFVDLCALIANGQSNDERFARELARHEWQLLFDDCFKQAQD